MKKETSNDTATTLEFHSSGRDGENASAVKNADAQNNAERGGIVQSMLRTASRMFLTGATALAGLFVTPSAVAQAQITAPPPGSSLAYPSFSLAWQNINAAEYFLYLGDQKGKNNYYGASMGKSTTVNLTWTNRPANCWVRVWSLINVYSGTSNSTVAYSYWASTDTYFMLDQQTQSSSAKAALIEEFVTAAISVAGTVSDYQRGILKPSVGQCKAFLASKFNTVGSKYRLASGRSPVMPGNPAPNEGVGVNNWYWAGDNVDPSGFSRVGYSVTPELTSTAKRNAVMALLRNVQRGDTLQMVMKASVSSSGTYTSDYVPHTITFVSGYISDSVSMNWVDSNMDGKGTPLVGNLWYWGSAKTLASLADRISGKYGAATLYRIRNDVYRR